MKICIPLFAMFLAVLCGCDLRHYIAGHGDVGQFVLQTAERFGGVPIATNGLPRISDEWRYIEESDRVMIMLPKQTFPAIGEFLHQSFGQPTGYGDNGRYFAYQLATNGAAIYDGAIIYLHQWDKETEVIICPHPLPNFSMTLPNKVAGANSRWALQFRYRGSPRTSAVAQLGR